MKYFGLLDEFSDKEIIIQDRIKAELIGEGENKVTIRFPHQDVNYKDVETIKKYISADRGKILPRRVTGNCAEHQRHIAKEIKNARHMALIPFVKD